MTIKCPMCNDEMQYDKGAYFCYKSKTDEYLSYHKVVVLCKCERRMIPEAKYNSEKFTFWKCPHCFNRR